MQTDTVPNRTPAPVRARPAAVWALLAFGLLLVLSPGAAADGDVLLPDGSPAAAQGSPGSGPAPTAVLLPPDESEGYRLVVVVGESMILHTRDVIRVAVADPHIADVVVASPKEVLINGVSPGRTTLHVWDQTGRSTFSLRVYEDWTEMAREIQSRIGLPDLWVWVTKGTVVLEGRVADPADRERALKIAGAYSERVVDLLRVSAEDTDQATAGRIAEALNDPEVRVTVVNGTVLLEGAVADEIAKERAVAVASSFGLRVVDLLRLQREPARESPPEAETSMSVLVEEVARAIGDDAIRVRAIQETLFLEGEVDEAYRSMRAEEIARAYGRPVVNLIRVAPAEETSGAVPVMAPAGDPAAAPVGSAEGDYRGGEASLQDLAARLAALSSHLGEAEMELRAMSHETVILDGFVSSPHGQERAARIASLYFPNVVDVTRVRGPVDPAQPGLAEIVAAALGRPSISVRAAGGKVILEGSVADQNELARVEAIAASYGSEVVSFLEIVDPIQVVLEVLVAEVDKGVAPTLGVTWGGVDRGIHIPHQFMAGEIALGSPIFRLSLLGARIDALVAEGTAKILAEPSLLTLSGKEATFLAGGEIPIAIPQDDRIVVEWKEFGVLLRMTPEVDTKGRIALEILSEVSTLDWANGIRVSNITLPALGTRRVETIVQVNDGETLAIGGLLHSEESREVEKFPVLGDLPIIGRLFSSERFSKNETELIFLITPTIYQSGDGAGEEGASP